MQASWLSTGAPIDVSTLRKHGVHYETLPLDLAGHQPTLDRLRDERGYLAQDQVVLSPDTKDLAAICAKFLDEHLHEDDEVRFVLEGEGIFDIRSEDDRWMRVKVVPGDLIVVPKGKHHRFELTERQQIRCVRLFKDPAGWVPIYRYEQKHT